MKKYISIIIFTILLSNGINIIALSENQNEDTIEIILTFPQLNELQIKSYQNKQLFTHEEFGYQKTG